jgi:hypothetical protein
MPHTYRLIIMFGVRAAFVHLDKNYGTRSGNDKEWQVSQSGRMCRPLLSNCQAPLGHRNLPLWMGVEVWLGSGLSGGALVWMPTQACCKHRTMQQKL